ncbi:tyrosine-type recombinase/integrase [Chitinimonas taiwanensis]|uniref:tyrosine-type recombinase/integrase n=1 Tax=Chitinimonas taiwanensis TaxID=240412 RepID=UPI0035B26B20
MYPPENFDEFIAAFLSHKRHSDGRSPRTIAAYGDVLARFKMFLQRDPRDATEDELILFTGLHLNKAYGMHARSRIPYVACIREFYSWLQQRGHCPVNLAARIEYPKAGKPLPNVMSLASAEKMMAAPDFSRFEGVRDATMMALLIGCGLRVSGLVGLNRSSITEYQVNDRHRRNQERRLALRVMEKGEKERLVPLTREAELLLRIYLDHPDRAAIDASLKDGDEVLFLNTINRRCPPHEWVGERRRMTDRGVQRMMVRYAEKVGVPRAEAHPHAARHLFGTELTEDDTPLQVTGALLGHASGESTKIYTHLAMGKTTAVMDRSSPLSKIKTPASALLGHMKERFTV